VQAHRAEETFVTSTDDIDLDEARERIMRYIREHPEHADYFPSVDAKNIDEPPGRLSWPADDLTARRDVRDDLDFLETLNQKNQ
jgi:hypothetical protein